MWQIWQFFMAKFGNFCGKIWQNLGFQMAIFCDARLIIQVHQIKTALYCHQQAACRLVCDVTESTHQLTVDKLYQIKKKRQPLRFFGS